MTAPSAVIVQKLWSYCHVLPDAGLTYFDYTEQLTYLLFLKMAHERTQHPWNQPSPIPAEYAWPTLASEDGDALEVRYRHTLEMLGRQPGMLGLIFRKAPNEIRDPAILRRIVVDLIDRQDVKTLLKVNGRAAVVVPDNVLFEGGAGETVRRRLLHECDVHTLLRLPTGIFYAPGVKASVLFFDRKPGAERPWTERLWIYDLRTNQHFTRTTNPLRRSDLDEFVACYRADDRRARTPTWSEANPNGRWRAFSYEELVARDKASLDIFCSTSFG